MERKKENVIFGWLETLRAVQSKNGDTIVFGTLIQSEKVDIVFFSKVWEECRSLVNVGNLVRLKGKFDDINIDKPSFNVSCVFDIEKESCLSCGEIDYKKLLLLNDGRVVCKTCAKKIPKEELIGFISFGKLSEIDDEEIDLLLNLLEDE